ncbi:SH3 domain-containing protein [Pseudotabrizicola formosa]|uniref:SH3 domain-containing protein n=1 Tax=Pseudotabrizicola formosa TaxID=2030009 RepID=UPI000CD274DC|nr:SH3 domain-containing protein [Pseudotabrizicola formosa]
MIRMLLVLCAGLYLTLQIGGQDKGQMRFGLAEAARAPARDVAAPSEAMATEERVNRPSATGAAFAEPATLPPQTPAPSDAAVIPVTFGTSQPIMQPRAVQARSDAATTPSATDGKLWYVTGRSVNVRSGPSTRNEVLGRLTRGEAVTVVAMEDNGWARVRMEGDGIDGFMSMSFLSDSAP